MELTAGRRILPPRMHQVSIAILALLVLAALFAPIVARYDPAQQSLQQLAPPGGGHWLGTDALGRDIFSRLLYALRTDLILIVPAAALPMLLGTAIGGIAGHFGGVLDTAVRWIADVFQGLPVYVFLIALVAVLGRGVTSLLTAFTALGWIVYARLIRTEVRRVKEANFVAAGYLLGHSWTGVLWRHVLPNANRQTAAYFVFDLGMALQGIAVLSFFNLGVPAGTPELGAMVAEAQIYLRSHAWLAAVPGATIVLLGLCIASLGDYVRARSGGES
ncbi:ABC transporter permease [Kribbella solani]|uniref:Peptide/nickel transport system permease protein n=1 Tax=Kribbella solani TaxID=236067 RepID=A0A841DYK1_9ACTN|nr:ABC transporter permease [Kribbella solani]MBB5983732.1 peptide/nickel transport system permease protein [Kribbella solani]